MPRKRKDAGYYCNAAAAAEDYGDYYSTEEDADEVYQSDSEYGVSDDDDYEQAEDPSDEEPKERGKDKEDYDFETEDDVRRCQDEVTAEISELLSVPQGFAAAFLRHCRWDAERLREEWFADEGRVRGAVGLAAAGRHGDVPIPTALNDRPLTCAICFDPYSPGEMRSAGFSHYYCHECWRGYIRVAVGDGSRCLLLRCPDPDCSVPVVRELVDAVAADEDRARYVMFVVRSFVEEGTNKYVRWCPGPGCTLAVRSEPGSRLYEVACACKHVFCFRCGEEAHRPALCETAVAWEGKNGSDGMTTQWVLANTKKCPKCQRAIEKNKGCNHMSCGAPCCHEFCWLCLGSWENHSGHNYHCNRYAAAAAAGDGESEFAEEETRREQARASLGRYLHYYERWSEHGASMRKARQDLDGLDGDGLDEFADAIGVPPTVLGFLVDAYDQIVEARRVLRWTYAYVYYLDPERDRVKLELCEFLQGEAESSLERLHKCAEGNVMSTTRLAAATFVEFRQKLCHLTLVTRSHFSKLVDVFESGMAEVVS